MKAEHRGSDVFMAGARINIEQGLPDRDDQQEDRKEHADADVSIGEPVPDVQHDPEADAEQPNALQQAQRTGKFAVRILQRHGRAQNARDHQHRHEKIDLVQPGKSAIGTGRRNIVRHAASRSTRLGRTGSPVCSQGMRKP